MARDIIQVYSEFKKLSLEELEARGKSEYLDLRKRWSFLLSLFLGWMLLFEAILTWKIGTGQWDFAEYQTFIYIVAGENFLQIVGMCYLVVNFLFPSDPKTGRKASNPIIKG